MLRNIFVILMAVLFSSCASGPRLNGSELSEKINNNFVIVDSIEKPVALAERTKAQAVGKFVVATVVSSVASSGNVNTKPGDMTALQNAAKQQMEFGMALNQQLQQSLPDSYKVASGAGVDLAIAKKLSDYYASKAKPDAYLQPKELHVRVGAVQWELGYVSFLTSQNYALNYNFVASLVESVDGKERVITSTNCLGVTEKEMPLEAWKADNYLHVNSEAEVVVEKCYNSFVRNIG